MMLSITFPVFVRPKISVDTSETESIIAFAPEEHLASQRVMQKCGMQFYKQDLGHGVKCHFYRMKL